MSLAVVLRVVNGKIEAVPAHPRRILLASLVVASGCATPPVQTIIVPTGSSFCAGESVTRAKCEAMHRVGETLHTPEMELAIKRAQAK